MFDRFFKIEDKPWYESLTAWGVIVFAAGSAAEGTGTLPTGSMAQVQGAFDAVVSLFGALGNAANEVGAAMMAVGLRRSSGRTATQA